MSDARAEAIDALAQAGDSPLMRSFPQGAVFTWDHELRYLSAGGHGLADVGLSRSMLEGRTIFEVFPPETSSAIEPLYRAALRGQTTTIDVPYEGHIYSQRLAPVIDRDGTIVAGMGFTQDVTHVRAAEAALRESEERARLTFQHAPIGQALVELDGRWRQVNSALVRLTGYSEAELRGMTFRDITHPDDLEDDLAQLDELVAGRIDSYQLEKRYFHASGAVVWVLLAVSLVRSEDRTPLYFVAQIQDITERKRQQEALEGLIAMLSHDLRTPLTAISGFTDLVLSDWEGRPDQQKLDLLMRVKSSAVVMTNLLEDTLTVSTLEAHGTQAAPSEVRVDLVVHEVLGMLSASLTSVDLAGLAPVTAWVDRSHVTQVVSNLLTNAIKYGGGVVTVTTEQRASGVRLRVSDHGDGVPPEFVAHLFDRFSRSTEARTGGQRGSGLGLYIVKRLLELNGGQVTYTDTPGGGSTFTVSLASRTSVVEAAQPSSTASHPQPV